MSRHSTRVQVGCQESSEHGDAHLDRARDQLAFFDPPFAQIPGAVSVLRSVLLPGREAAPIVVPEEHGSEVFLRLAHHRVLPQLAEAVSTGRVILPEDARRQLDEACAPLVVQGMKLEHVMVRVAKAFAADDISFLVLKGLATSRVDHRRPEDRTAVDVDLLINEDALTDAGRALERTGLSYPYAIESLMDKGETWVDPAGWHVDLHVRLHASSRAVGEYWWTNADDFEVAGRHFRCLSRGGRMAHAASHLALSWPSERRLSSLLDLAVIAELASPQDFRDAERLLAEMGVGDIVWRITTRAADLLDMPELKLGQRGRRPFDVIIRAAYDRPVDSKFAIKMAKFIGKPWREKRRILDNWIHPSSEYLARGGYRSRSDRLRKVTGRLFHRGHG